MATTVAAARGVNLRETTFDDFEQISRLERRFDVGRKSFEDWRRLWSANPAYRRRQGWPIGWVLDHDGRIVGSLGNIPIDYELDGRTIVAATGRSWVSEAEYRGYAAMLMEEFFQQKNVDLFLSTTVNHKAQEAFAAFGVRPAPAGEWDHSAFWITNCRGFARAFAAARGWRIPVWLAAPALLAKQSFRGSPLDAGRNLAVWQELGFDERFDAFWDELRERKTGELLAVRSREALEWHFHGPLAKRRLWILTVQERGRIAAYSIFCRKDSRARGLTRMRVVDYQSLGDEREPLMAMLAWALRLCREEGIHVLEDLGCCLRSVNAPNRRRLTSWTSYYKAGDPWLADRLSRPGAWQPSLFDGDSSL